MDNLWIYYDIVGGTVDASGTMDINGISKHVNYTAYGACVSVKLDRVEQRRIDPVVPGANPLDDFRDSSEPRDPGVWVEDDKPLPGQELIKVVHDRINNYLANFRGFGETVEYEHESDEIAGMMDNPMDDHEDESDGTSYLIHVNNGVVDRIRSMDSDGTVPEEVERY